MRTFYLGVHHPSALAKTSVPLFISRRALVLPGDRQRKTLPRARGIWALDSAGFTELHKYGRHHLSPRDYAAEACRYQEEIGGLSFAAIQDHMTEPEVMRITGKSIYYHHMKTIESLATLRAIAPGVPWAPVLQGWEEGEHEEHLALYHRNGFDLRAEKIVGVGSVCRRLRVVGTADDFVRSLSGYGLRLHLFGYKRDGLPGTLNFVESADSMAWSFTAKKQSLRLPSCQHRHDRDSRYKNGPKKGQLRWRAGSLSDCRNCLDYALHWRRETLRKAAREARPDYWERHFGGRPPTDDELVAYYGVDPAEGFELTDWVPGGDYQQRTADLEIASGTRVDAVPNPHYLGDSRQACAPSAYAVRGAAKVKLPKAPAPESFRPIGKRGEQERPGVPRRRPPRAFVPWFPRQANGRRVRADVPVACQVSRNPDLRTRYATSDEAPSAQRGLFETADSTASGLTILPETALRVPFEKGLHGHRIIDPFREEPEAVEAALAALAEATPGLPWPASSVRVSRITAVDTHSILRLPCIDGLRRGPGVFGGLDHLEPWEMIGLWEMHETPKTAHRQARWLRDGWPAIVVASTDDDSIVVGGIDQMDLAAEIGQTALPVLRLRPDAKHLRALERLIAARRRR